MKFSTRRDTKSASLFCTGTTTPADCLTKQPKSSLTILEEKVEKQKTKIIKETKEQEAVKYPGKIYRFSLNSLCSF